MLTVLLGLYCIADNKRRDRKQGVKMRGQDVPTEKMRDGPRSEDFRYVAMCGCEADLLLRENLRGGIAAVLLRTLAVKPRPGTPPLQ